MTEDLMSDERHDQLLKAAEDTVGMMNIGVEPHAALAKVAEDSQMNAHEVEVVAHAVNNSRQLAHLQNSQGDDREKEFPVIDPKNVRSHGDTQPATNADASTGTRYGTPDTPGDNVEAKNEALDADEIHEELQKAASATYVESGDYRLQPTTPDYAGQLREGWGLGRDSSYTPYEDPNPFAKISNYQLGIEEARLRYQQNVDGCLAAMQKVADGMRLMDAPEWADVERTALKLGAERSTLDLVFNSCDIEKFGAQRCDPHEKLAEVIRPSPRVFELATYCVRADTLWKEAADVAAAGGVLHQQQAEAEAALFPKEAGDANTPLGVQANVSASLGELAEPIEKAPEEFTGLNPENIQQALGGGVAQGGDGRPFRPGYDLRQEMRNTDTRHTLEGLMEDDFIGGHSVPEVVDAYNDAMSVNPNFGHAELVSYMRQHLATGGGVPLDLQIRARPRQQIDKDND